MPIHNDDVIAEAEADADADADAHEDADDVVASGPVK